MTRIKRRYSYCTFFMYYGVCAYSSKYIHNHIHTPVLPKSIQVISTHTLYSNIVQHRLRMARGLAMAICRRVAAAPRRAAAWPARECVIPAAERAAAAGRKSSSSSTFYDEVFKEAGGGPADADGPFLVGQTMKHAVNLRRARPGDVIRVPYEVTVSPALRDLWHGAFFSHDRLSQSTPFARAMGFQDQLLPFNLMLFLAGSMSHAEEAMVQLQFRKACYLWPGFAGDTFHKRFKVSPRPRREAMVACLV